jgi:hypothetical protein
MFRRGTKSMPVITLWERMASITEARQQTTEAGTGSPFDAKGLADIMRKNGFEPGMNVRLYICNAGRGGNQSLAQELAKELNANVEAAANFFWLMSDGSVVIAPKKWLGFSDQPNVAKQEDFRMFKP